jgi:hypothetical protein
MSSFCLRPLHAGSGPAPVFLGLLKVLEDLFRVLAFVRLYMRRVTALIALSSIACAAGYIVQDNDARLQYEGVWYVSQDENSSGGTEHRTNVHGARVILSNFTGLSSWLSMIDAIRLIIDIQGVQQQYSDAPHAMERSSHLRSWMVGQRCCALLAPTPRRRSIKKSSVLLEALMGRFITRWS